MRLDKKGIMLKFLVTVILALIIFIPACIGISKIFRLSSQASGSFTDFAKEIKDLAEHGQEGEKRSVLLILDQDTFVANLWVGLNLEEFTRCAPRYEEHWRGVGQTCHGNDCLCLIKEYAAKYGDIGTACGQTLSILELTPAKISCTEFPEQYYVYGVDWNTWNRFDESDQRRVKFQLTKKGNVIYVCRDTCEIPTNPKHHPSKLFQEPSSS